MNTRDSINYSNSHYGPFDHDGILRVVAEHREQKIKEEQLNAHRELTPNEIAMLELFGEEYESDIRNHRAISCGVIQDTEECGKKIHFTDLMPDLRGKLPRETTKTIDSERVERIHFTDLM